MTVMQGDCLTELKKIESSSIDLIYLDPPFFTQKKHFSKNRENNKEYEFMDSWESINEYTNYMKERLYECKRVLKNTGSIFLHCDKNASHYLRVVLDDVFGMDNFQSEIIWNFKRWSNSKIGLLNNHQNIYFYSKTTTFKFNSIYTSYSATTNIDQILQDRARDKNLKSTYKVDEEGNVILGKEKKGVPLSDVWNIPFLNPKAKERTGYPTQKPILLLEQIIRIASDEGDTILDPFCGSGTTLVAALLMNRNYVGIDISLEAVNLTKERLNNPVKTTSAFLENGEKKYLNKSEYELSILNILDAIPVQRNNGIDGFLKKHYSGRPVSIKIQKGNENLDQAISLLLKASNKRKCILKILIRTKESELLNLDLFNREHENLIILDSFDFAINKYFSHC